ncbi:MAG: nuclear transport factor 2 family protein, partial [Gemmatimonadota bacterium]|nr:nuclear transport factor 2 family protein [Gemmatimonadota bacterium]
MTRRPFLRRGLSRPFAVVFALAFVACGPSGSDTDVDSATDPAADEAAVRALFDEVERSENEKDLEEWRKTITDDVLFIAPTGAIQGSEPLHAAMAAVLGAFDLNQSHTVEGIQVSGDLAEMWGRFSDVRTPR